MEENFDHIIIGKQLQHFVYPPTSLKVVEGFEDGLKETIPQKLEQLLERCQKLKDIRDLYLRAIITVTERNSREQYFYVSLIFHEFSEYYVIQKWLNYWLSLWYKITNLELPTQLQTKLNKIDQADIEKARQFSIIDLYDGNLKKSGSKYVGLCPFHLEKTPSFFIYPNNTYHCFGCEVHGDSISFIRELNNLSFPDAVRGLL